MSDSTEWVTVKVPEKARERAADVKDEQGDTWGGVLMFYATHRGNVHENAVPNTDAGDPLDGALAATGVCSVPDDLKERLDRIEEAQGGTVNRSLELAENDMEAVLEKLDRIESAAKEATNAAQSAEHAVGELQR